jgi:putative NIF3 family GTP cyclohydrolase 1 type 2
MKLIDMYKMAVEAGIRNDPRPKKDIEQLLKDSKEAYDKLDADKKEFFDLERLWNPYADTRFSFGDHNKNVKKIVWGIDVDTGEVVLTDRLNEKGAKIDAIVGHHPIGMGRVPFPEVISMQTEMYHAGGIPINIAESMIDKRVDEVLRAVAAANYNQSIDAARLLNIPIMCIHTPADNMVQNFLETMFKKENPRNLGDIVDLLMTIPEYRIASKQNSPPTIIAGKKKGRCGKLMFKMTGGTSGPKEIYEKMAQAGVGTAIGMHFPESHVEEAKKNCINLIVAGHMSSDSLGINLIADIWEKKGIETLPFSGVIRYSRN